MRVEEAMCEGAHACAPDLPLREVATMMRDADVGSIAVVDGEELAGIVTDRDLALRAIADGRDPDALSAADVMTTDVVCCQAHESLEDAVHLMEDRRVRRLPVLDRTKHVVGMLSLGDIGAATSQSLTGELTKAVSAHH